MRILIVYPGIIPVKLYGGTERVIWYLGKELAKLGHKVSYLCNENSTCPFGDIIPIDKTKEFVEQIPGDIDIVHFNFTPKNIELLKKPYLITIHGNSKNTNAYDLNTVFVSKNHAERNGSDSFVHNGLDWSDYAKPNLQQARKYFHFLGKAAWRVKNVQGAIDVIKATKLERLKVLGGKRFNIKMGLRLTFSPRISFEGMVGGEKKDQLIGHSKGLVFPVKWHEPFGLATIESLYFGCPVFGTPYGALPEIVIDEVGFLSNKKETLAEAIENSNEFSRQICNEYAVENFNSKKMAMAYLQKYEMVLGKKTLNKKLPKLIKVQQTKFLKWE